MRQQSMAQLIGELEEQGFITRTPDPHDRRRTLIAVSNAGRAALAEHRRRREGWLASAIMQLSPTELQAIAQVLPVLRQLSES